jgi:hypothetical protein
MYQNARKFAGHDVPSELRLGQECVASVRVERHAIVPFTSPNVGRP